MIHYCRVCGREMQKVTGTKGIYVCRCGAELNTKLKRRLYSTVGNE